MAVGGVLVGWGGTCILISLPWGDQEEPVASLGGTESSSHGAPHLRQRVL